MTRLIHRTDEPRVPAPETTVRQQGVVTYHNPEKGYGKIHGDGIEYFFHTTACGGRFRALAEGTAVTFVEEETDKGPRALKVQQDTHPRPGDLDAADTRGNR